MEANTNLSKVLNPRPVLSGILLKYTNYVKGKSRIPNDNCYII